MNVKINNEKSFCTGCNKYVRCSYRNKTCTTCHRKELKKTGWIRNKEQDRRINRKWSKTIKGLWSLGRRTAKKKDLEWDISLEQFIELRKNVCFYCSGELPQHGYGLDRIDNNSGYKLINVLPCCAVCNEIRGRNLTVAEMVLVIHTLKAYRSQNVKTCK